MKKRFGKKSLIFILTFVLTALVIAIAAVAANYTDENNTEWIFTPNLNDMTATITGVNIAEQTKEFNIPETVSDGNNTYTVTAIGDNAFKDKKTVFGQLTIPETVTSIGKNAFASTYIFGSVTIPESVTSIGSAAFYNCDGLIEVTLPSNITVLENSLFEGCYGLSKVNTENIVTFKSKCFHSCQALTGVVFGENARTVESEAFYQCYSIGGTVDNSMMTSISDNAFKECISIEEVILPNDNIRFGAYNGCTKIQKFTATEENKKYLSIDGVLFSLDGKELLKYPTHREDEIYTVPNGVEIIKENAFNGTVYLEEVIISGDVTTLDQKAFASSSIKFAYIPDNVTSVGFYLFENCSNLETIIFGHSIEVIGIDSFKNSNNIKTVILKNNMASAVATNGKFYYADEYPCTNHIYGYEDKAPSCSEAGYNKCIICDRYAYVKETNHIGAVLSEVKVSCTSDGYKIIDCLECGQVTVPTDRTAGHISNGVVQYVRGSFKTPDFKYSTCTVCKQMYVFDYVANFNILGDANCDGVVNFKDYYTIKQYIDNPSSATEISLTNSNIVNDTAVDNKDLTYLYDYLTGRISELPNVNRPACQNHSKEYINLVTRSCKNDGFLVGYCTTCGSLTDELVSPKLPHTVTEENVINPTCSIEGMKISFCSTCNDKVYETIEKLEHSGKWYTINSQRGYEYRKCTVCGVTENNEVDYSVFDTLIKQIPKYYEIYFSTETVNLIKPILKNYDLSLTQTEINDNVAILSNALSNAQYNIYDTPTIFIQETPVGQSEGYIPTTIIVVSPGENGKTEVEAIDYNGQIKVRGRGSAGWTAKHPYNIKFNTKTDLFGMGKSKKYCLLSNYNDSTMIRNAVMFELSELLGIEMTCQYKIVDVYAKGEYKGSYMLTTASDTIGEDRVDIDEYNDFLLEIEKQHENKDLVDCFNFVSPIFGIKFLANSPEKVDMSAEAMSSIKSTIAKIDFAIKSGNWDLIQKYIDVDSVARYFILHDMLKEIDIVWDSTRFYIKDGKLYGGPGWDFDYSMFWDEIHGGTAFSEQAFYKNSSADRMCEGGELGKYYTGVWASVTWLCPNKTSSDDKIWFCSLYKNSPEFVTLVCEYVAELNDEISLLYEDGVDENGNTVKNVLDSIVYNQENRNSFSHNCTSGKDRYNKTMYSFQSKIETLRVWLKNRNEWMQGFYAEKINNPEYVQ